MEFTHGRRDSRSFTSAEEEDERGGGVHPFLPAVSSSSSSAIVLHWAEGSHESTEGEQPPPLLPAAAVEKEHMFEKVLTPSDVGKLNRLVIPKQHAEKYFPLDASTHDKGLLLNFEDRNGKPWRFRYSYWNSSQSYVMTKGWSRFVKEKRLDAGDTVSFSRGVGEAVHDRLFIDWNRRPDAHLDPPAYLRIPAGRFPYSSHSSISSSSVHHHHHHPYLSFSRSSTAPWAAGRLFVPHTPAPASPHSANCFYFRSSSAASQALQCVPQHDSGLPNIPMVLDSVPVARKAAATPKHFRLFGVNLDLHPADDTVGLLKLQLRAPLPAPDLRLGRGIGSSSAASSSSSSRGPKDDEHSNSPP